MKYFSLTTIIVLSILTVNVAHAARMTIVAGEVAPPSGEAFPILLMLDTEGATVSGLSGSFSFDESLFSVDSISTDNSVVSPWVVSPQVSSERYFDGRTHIIFEGIFAGGYSGVKSPYYKGEREGKVITVFLRPKKAGETNFVLDSLSLRAFNEDATEIPIQGVVKRIKVGEDTRITKKVDRELVRVSGENITAMIAKSDLIGRGAFHLVVDDKGGRSSVALMYVAESKSYDDRFLNEADWHKANNPYILLSQDRSKYIHVKIIYSDGTYAVKTIAPVDNKPTSSSNSHILLGIGMLIVAFCLYVYSKRQKFFNQKKHE